MRVIAGIYRSRPLTAPLGLKTRPTTDRLRETLFNVLAPRIAGSTFADLYAGSGANGIEALSRGAGYVYFVENGPAPLAAIRDNLKTLGISSGFSIEARSVAAFLSRLQDTVVKATVQSRVENQVVTEIEAGSGGRIASSATQLNIVFLDPPYDDVDAYATTLGLLGDDCVEVLAPDAIVIAEHRVKRPLSEGYGLLQRYRVLKQGETALSFYAAAELDGTDRVDG